MAVRRALLDCAVLSVQEGSVVYPFCNNCYSRIDVQLQDYKICACSKCGYNCPKAQVGYRYRLSLKVARQTSIFGVTVFGTCLDPFFGIHASGLQRLMEEEPVEAATRAPLLKQAVEDCFIGRHLTFGIKVKDTDHGPWFDGSSGVTVGTTAGPAQFIATQIHPTPAGGGEGCSVLRYYHALQQRAGALQPRAGALQPRAGALRSPGSSKAFKPAAPLVLPLKSPGRAGLSTPPHSPLLSCSLSSPDSPWQRSIGVVTSSAEQDTQQDEGNEHDGRPLHHHHRRANERPADSQRAPATALHSSNKRRFSINHSFKCTLWSPSAAEVPSIAPIPPTCPRPLPYRGSPPENQPVDVLECDPQAWEDDMAYSESLEAFIVCQEKWSESRTASTDCDRNSYGSALHSSRMTLADVSKTCAPSCACDAMHKSARLVNKVVGTKGTPMCGGCSPPVSFDPMGCQGLCVDGPAQACDGDITDDIYNCSADLFSDPMALVTLATEMLDQKVGGPANGQIIVTHSDSQTLNTDENTSSLDSPESTARSDQNLETKTLPAHHYLFRSNKHGVGCSRYRASDSNQFPPLRNQTTLGSIIHGSEPVPLDFIPPSQSTPLRIHVHTGSGSAAVHQTSAGSRRLGCLKPDRQPPFLPRVIITTPPPTGCSASNRFPASHSRTQPLLGLHPGTSKTPTKRNHNLNLISRRRLRNLNRANHNLTSRQILNLQCHAALGLKCFKDVSISVLCVDNDDDMVVTPLIGEMSFPVSAGQGENADGCIRQTPSSEISGTQTNAVESKTWGRSAEGMRKDGSLHHFLFNEDQEFDLSGDLFADSFH
ncbi:uncharacterized protein ddias [Gadus morhua]|uniref:Replication factor A C-terminal domain-containing protein n=1 Tax=Gadus morhua TaxID=8049 RepID=A0A8C5BNH9_GADMO|nr:DNA damage-induced apoptosis suppressor protein [Gadus morhua]